MNELCSEEKMETLVKVMQTGAGNDLASIEELLSQHPGDPRLHFLKGSVLVGEGKLIEGYAALRQAVDIAPDFSIARFQLGFFQLTSGEADNALDTWAKLDELPDDNYLKVFVTGLRHLIRDEISQCISCLQTGMALNNENPPLNNDMNLIIEQVTPLLDGEKPAQTEEDATSATSFFLNQFSDKPTKH